MAVNHMVKSYCHLMHFDVDNVIDVLFLAIIFMDDKPLMTKLTTVYVHP